MEAVYFGNATTWGKGQGSGPWVMADMENGLFAGNTRENDNNTPLTSEFVTAMVKGGENGFALKGGDATQGGLKTMYDGARPNGYQPMRKCVHQSGTRPGPQPPASSPYVRPTAPTAIRATDPLPTQAGLHHSGHRRRQQRQRRRHLLRGLRCVGVFSFSFLSPPSLTRSRTSSARPTNAPLPTMPQSRRASARTRQTTPSRPTSWRPATASERGDSREAPAEKARNR